MVMQTFEPGLTVSMVARTAGIVAAELFEWKKANQEGSLVPVGANESVEPTSEMVEAIKSIKQQEGALGRKTLQNEIIKEAVE